jgi:hypothetical protein
MKYSKKNNKYRKTRIYSKSSRVKNFRRKQYGGVYYDNAQERPSQQSISNPLTISKQNVSNSEWYIITIPTITSHEMSAPQTQDVVSNHAWDIHDLHDKTKYLSTDYVSIIDSLPPLNSNAADKRTNHTWILEYDNNNHLEWVRTDKTEQATYYDTKNPLNLNWYLDKLKEQKEYDGEQHKSARSKQEEESAKQKEIARQNIERDIQHEEKITKLNQEELRKESFKNQRADAATHANKNGWYIDTTNDTPPKNFLKNTNFPDNTFPLEYINAGANTLDDLPDTKDGWFPEPIATPQKSSMVMFGVGLPLDDGEWNNHGYGRASKLVKLSSIGRSVKKINYNE